MSFAHAYWGQEYPGDGQQAFGFILLFAVIGMACAGFYLLVGSGLHGFLRRGPWRRVMFIDSVLAILLVMVLGYAGVTAEYSDEATKTVESTGTSTDR